MTEVVSIRFQPLEADPGQRWPWEHSSWTSPGPRLRSEAHRAWSRLSQSWRLCQARTPGNFTQEECLLPTRSSASKVISRRKKTHTSKVLVQQLNIAVDDLQCNQFVISGLNRAMTCKFMSTPLPSYINCRAEVETGVALVDDLEVLPLEERAHLWLPGGNCIKIGLPGKSIFRDYFQENITSRRPFLLLRIRGLIQ